MKGTKKNVEATKSNPFLLYKGKPFLRCGDIIYYGNSTDKYVIKMEIKETKPFKDLEIASKVCVAMVDTKGGIDDAKKIVKMSEKNGLYEAMDIAQVWLYRAENSSM